MNRFNPFRSVLFFFWVLLLATACNDNSDNSDNSNGGEDGSSDTDTDTDVDTDTDTDTDADADADSDSSIGTDDVFVYAVNAGGADGALLNDIEYKADRFASGGDVQTVSDSIQGTDEPTLYQSERYGSYSYEIPVSNATYSVLLHFAELYHTVANARVFTITVEGVTVVDEFDLFAAAGASTAWDTSIKDVIVTDGSLSINLSTTIDNATIAGFAIFSNDGGRFIEPPEPVDGDITVDISQRFQIIDGFGGAVPMWYGTTWTEAETRKLVGMGDDELGLSIVRTIIRPDDDDWALHTGTLKEAESYGSEVKIIASPWSPPPEWKDNKSVKNGGKLLTSYYGDYALHLNAFVEQMSDDGVNIDVTSIQNEPNWHPDYESCDWSGAEFETFLVDHADKIQNTQITIAETIGFQTDWTDLSLNNPEAESKIDIISGHLYGPWDTAAHAPGYALRPYDLATQKGKPVWMTEWNYHAADNVDNKEPPEGHPNRGIWADATNEAVWNETLDDIVASVHYSMEANWNAYIWWWARRYYSFIGENRNDGFATPAGEILKRGWAFSQFSKYVRPGYVRVDVSQNSTVGSNVLITAYLGDDNKIVLVIINKDNSDKDNVSIGLPVEPISADFTYTSRYSARADSTVTLNGQHAVISIPARSISTVVVNY